MTSAQALIHGDLHTGSIMATLEDTRVIDPEFAFIGPIGFDVGAVIGNLLLAFFAQEGHEAASGARDAYRDWILVQAEKVWSGFHRRFLELWRAAPSGDAYPASLFPSDDDRAAMDKERAAVHARPVRGHLGLRGRKNDPPHPRPRPCRGPGGHRGPGTARALRGQGAAARAKLVLGAEDFSSLADVTRAARTVGSVS